MTESPPRSDLPPEQDAAPRLRVPPALPVAPWWAASPVADPEPGPGRAPDPDPVIAAAEEILEAESVAESLRESGALMESGDLLETVSAPLEQVLAAPSPPLEEAAVQVAPADAQAVQAVQAVPVGPVVAPPPGPVPPPSPLTAPKARGKGLLVLLCGALAVGVLGAATVAVLLITRAGAEVVSLRTVTATGTAGGLRKDAAVPEAGASYPFVIAAARGAGVEHAITATGVYRDPAGGERDVLFLGGTAAIGDPGPFLRRARPSTVLDVRPVPATGKDGGKVHCGTFAVLAATHLYCAWATGDSFGFVASNEPAGAERPVDFANLVGAMRADLEKIAR